jgi:hypothetical protein
MSDLFLPYLIMLFQLRLYSIKCYKIHDQWKGKDLEKVAAVYFKTLSWETKIISERTAGRFGEI